MGIGNFEGIIYFMKKNPGKKLQKTMKFYLAKKRNACLKTNYVILITVVSIKPPESNAKFN